MLTADSNASPNMSRTWYASYSESHNTAHTAHTAHNDLSTSGLRNSSMLAQHIVLVNATAWAQTALRVQPAG
jgi:hypothetical protein